MTGAIATVVGQIVIWLIEAFVTGKKEKEEAKKRFLRYMSAYSTKIESRQLKDSFEKQLKALENEENAK